MTTPNTYRSVVTNLIAALEKEHGDQLSGWGIDAALGPLADVYRQAKALTTDEKTPTVFITTEPDGRLDASIENTGLSDIAVVFVDQTIFDKEGSLISIVRDNGNVFGATVKMVIPSPTYFDTDKVFDVAKRNPFQKGKHYLSAMERVIDTFVRWANDSQPDHYRLLKTASKAIEEHGFDAYEPYLTEALAEFETGMLARAKRLDPGADSAADEARLRSWIGENMKQGEPGLAIAAAVYERGERLVLEAFEHEPKFGPSI